MECSDQINIFEYVKERGEGSCSVSSSKEYLSSCEEDETAQTADSVKDQQDKAATQGVAPSRTGLVLARPEYANNSDLSSSYVQ